jgi:hypothetical protein
MSTAKQASDLASTALDATRWAQLVTLVKENQLVTALCLFVLWQTGAILTMSQEVSGVMC